MKKIVLCIACIAFSTISLAQQDAQYAQYMYNPINFNPAYAGSRNVLSIFGLHRSQWIGLDGAPITNAFSIHAPIENTNLGLGLSFVNDEIGPTDVNRISADVSYTIPTSENWKLAFGVKATINSFSFDINKLRAKNQLDPQFQGIDNNFTPNVGAGFFFYSEKTYFGLSVPNMLEQIEYNDNNVAMNAQRMNLYFAGGHVFDLSSAIKFKPAFVFKTVVGAPLQTDLSANFLFNQKFVLGAAWRWSAAASILTGIQVNDGLYFGYSYDIETTRLVNYNKGSHEVFLRYEFTSSKKQIVSPRFF